ncbi:MAG: IPT/TIG domain-containing protein [Proteobacteria bacterium]|nr:IPT/TIG domain-containing protein [Pseudomonadota bacterium]
MRALPLLLVLSGCWLTDTELDGKLEVPQDSGETLDPLVVTSISPAFGPDSGGTEVFLVVGPLLSSEPVVRFGDIEARVLESDGVSVKVVAPPRDAPGAVDITVGDSGRNITSESAFTYHPDRSGLNSVLGSLTYIEYVGDSWGTQIERPADFGYGWLSFVQPTTVDYAEMFHGTRLDTCEREYNWAGSLTDLPIGASSATLTTGAQSLSLPFDNSTLSFEADLTIAQYRPGSTFDLSAFDSQTYPAFDVPGLVHTPLPFSVTQPEFDELVNSTFDVTWTTAETGDYAIVRVDLFDHFVGDFIETVRCVVVDDGRFQVSSSNFTQWSAFDQTARIWVGRVFESDAVLPHDASSSGVAGVYWVIGLAPTDL